MTHWASGCALNTIRVLAGRAVLMLAIVIVASGCAETNIQAIHRLRPAYDVYRSFFCASPKTICPNDSEWRHLSFMYRPGKWWGHFQWW